MYCLVIFDRNVVSHHTEKYLYKVENSINILQGMTVIVPTQKKKKLALVHSVYSDIPPDINISLGEIESINYVNKREIRSETIREYVLAMIDEYKDGKVSIKDFYTVMKSFIGNNILNYGKDEILQKSVHELMANIDSFYIGKSGNEKMEFWKLLKDTQYLLLYGYTYKEHQGREVFLNDSIEYTDEYLTIELEMERMIKDEVGEGGYFGFCHKYWSAKKRILKEYFEIDWKNPEEMNPDVIFD